jgi:cold shock CspA family protein
VNREERASVDGGVVMWEDEQGLGAPASSVLEGEVWAHFSNIVIEGYKTLRVGQLVSFTYETPGQDGPPSSDL